MRFQVSAPQRIAGAVRLDAKIKLLENDYFPATHRTLSCVFVIFNLDIGLQGLVLFLTPDTRHLKPMKPMNCRHPNPMAEFTREIFQQSGKHQ